MEKPKTIGKFTLRWTLRLACLLLCIAVGVSISLGQYSLFYYLSIPQIMQSQEIVFMPEDKTLRSEIRFSDMTQNEGTEKSSIKLKNEVYRFKLRLLAVPETQSNLSQGNLYLTAKFTSNYKSQKDFVVNRMGSFVYKS